MVMAVPLDLGHGNKGYLMVMADPLDLGHGKNNSEQYTLEDNPKVYWNGSIVKQYVISSIVTKFNCDRCCYF